MYTGLPENKVNPMETVPHIGKWGNKYYTYW